MGEKYEVVDVWRPKDDLMDLIFFDQDACGTGSALENAGREGSKSRARYLGMRSLLGRGFR